MGDNKDKKTEKIDNELSELLDSMYLPKNVSSSIT